MQPVLNCSSQSVCSKKTKQSGVEAAGVVRVRREGYAAWLSEAGLIDTCSLVHRQDEHKLKWLEGNQISK